MTVRRVRTRMVVETLLVAVLAGLGVLVWRAATAPATLDVGSASGVTGPYAEVLPLFEAEPDRWGGAYVDGDRLVVKVGGRPLHDAAAELAAQGITSGVTLVESRYSLAQLNAQLQRVDDVLSGRLTRGGVRGPSYDDSTVTVTLHWRDLGLRDDVLDAADPDGPPVRVRFTTAVPVPVAN